MYIENLVCKPGNHSITVTMNYDEVRDIANGLYLLTSCNDLSEVGEKDKNRYLGIASKSSFLFDMIKHGMIQQSTLSKMMNEGREVIVENTNKSDKEEKSNLC